MSQMNLPAHHPLAFGYNPFGGYPTAATMAALQSPFAGPIPADPDSSSGRSSSSNADTSTVAAHIPAFVGPTTAETTMLAAQEHQQVDIQLANAELWQKFHRLQNEMVVTRPGRKMFPKLELHLHGLDPKSQYTLFLYMQKIDNYRYKYQAGGWSTAGQEDSNGLQLSNRVQHHEGWNSGEFWASQERVVFERVKLTNKEIQQGGNSLISLCSMQKYQPVVLLFRSQGAASVLIQEFRPAECQFIAVTAYQSDAVTKLKVEHNPFAKGFREGSSRKRTLSPMPGMTVSFHSSLPQHFLAAAASNCHPPPAKRSLLGSPAASLPIPFQFPVYGGGHFGASFPPAAAAWFSNPTAQLTAMASQIVAAEPPATAQPPMAIDPLNFLTLYNNFFQMMAGQQQVAKKEEEQAQKTP